MMSFEKRRNASFRIDGTGPSSRRCTQRWYIGPSPASVASDFFHESPAPPVTRSNQCSPSFSTFPGSPDFALPGNAASGSRIVNARSPWLWLNERLAF
jgi:hypothetical protein